MPLNPSNDLDYLEPVATGLGLNMEGSSANEQANPTFSMNSLNIYSHSIDSVSGTSASAGPASVASTSESTVKIFHRMHVGKSKTARYVSRNPYITEAYGFYLETYVWQIGNNRTLRESLQSLQNIITIFLLRKNW